jgi:alpha-2-macroglobulin
VPAETRVGEIGALIASTRPYDDLAVFGAEVNSWATGGLGMRRVMRRWEPVVMALLLGFAAAADAAALTVEQFSPQGTVKNVRQVTARFSAPMVPFGDLRDVAAPFTIDCPETGTARWVDSRTWAYDFTRDLPAGVRCTFSVREGLRSLDGEPVGGPVRFTFSTGGPVVTSTLPGEGTDRIEEEQAFVVSLNGEPARESVRAHAGFEVQGIAERVGIELIEGEARDQLIANLPHWLKPEGPAMVLKARQAFPHRAKVRLIWGAGIASPSGVVTARDQVLEYRVRPPFTAKFSCERENPKANCVPLTPVQIVFSAPVAWDLAKQIRLVDPDGAARAPAQPDDPVDLVTSIEFEPPFPESTTFRLTVPPDLRDDAGRPLANRDAPSLTLKTAPSPPLAKFAARFGILESEADPALPLTIRNLDPVVQGRQLAVTQEPIPGWSSTVRDLYARLTGTVSRVPPDKPEEILPWLRRLGTARRSVSIFADGTPSAGRETTTFTLPQPDGSDAFQVVGIPFQNPGFYLVELASPRLGAALLDNSQPMFVPAGALVTNLSVHLEWARESTLVWVTTLDRAKPVEGAHIAVQDCNGKVIASGQTDGDGLARFGDLPDEEHVARCYRSAQFEGFDRLDYRDYYAASALNELDSGIFVTAQTNGDLSFVHSSWRDGIEPWRFQLPSEGWQAPVAVHTILDRPLFRAGDTVHMKHVLRRETMAGFGLFPAAQQPTTTVIRHLGSNETYELPLTWDAAGLAEQSWAIPAGAKLGQYDVSLKLGSQQWTSGTFRLEQFRVPLTKASVLLPGQPQVGAAAVPVDIAIQYLAGGPAAELPVMLRAQIRNRQPPKLDDFEHATFANGPVKEGIVRQSDSEDEEPAGAEKPGVHQRQQLTLDAAGTAHAEISALPGVTTVRELLTEVEYRDPNGEAQTAAATVPLWPAALLPGIEAEHWAGAKKSVKTTVVVLDTRSRPVAGAPVKVEVYKRRLYSHRKRLVGGFYAYEHVEETSRVQPFCEGDTNAQGVLECAGAPPTDGELILQATVTDAAGRTAAAHESVYVSGASEWGFSVDASDRIDVVPEKREYEPGETARLQVRMPFKRATALVTVQREGVGKAHVLRLSAKDPVVEIPIRGEYAPNTFVSVFLVRGRVGDVQPTAMLDLGKPAFKLGIAEIRVGWRAHRLSVDVSADRSAYRVRETATVRIAVRSDDGTPLTAGGEVAVAAVDEGLLELMPNKSWNLLEAMMGRRGYGVRTATAQMEVIGKRHFGRKSLPSGGGGGRQSTRELFDTLLLWQGRVPLDADGNATVEIPLNDSLTSFRIAAVATGGVGQFGTGFTEIRSTQDIMLLSGLPPVVRQGDVLPAQFTLRNTTQATQQVEVRCQVDGLAEPLPPQQVSLDAGAARVVEWTITVPPTADTLRYTIEASAAGGPSDRLAVSQRVLPAVPVRTLQATLVRWEPNLRMPIERPADALPDRGGVDVAASASLAGSLEPLHQWLLDYPYSCLEQKVSIAVGLGDEKRWQEVSAALPSYLDAEGLLKFFPTMDAGSEVLTAYVLSVSKAAGWTLPASVQEKMISGLRGFVDGSVRRESPLDAPDLTLRKLAAIEALARADSADTDLLDSIAVEPNLWPTSAVLDWWSILQRMPSIAGRDARLRAAEQIVRARLNLQGTTMGFSSERSDSLYWLLTGPDVNALRLILQLVEFNLWRDDVPRLVRGALARQERGIWDTTVADAWGAVAMRRFSAAFEATPVTGATTVTLASAAQTLEWTTPPPPVTLPWPPQPADLVVDHAGTGNPWMTVSSRAAIPLTAPLTSGYRITKTVTPVDPRTPGTLRVGDKLHVRLEIEAQSDMTWVVVDDPLPAGASHLGTGLARDSQIEAGESEALRAPAFVERRFEAYRAYYDFVEKGRLVAEYTLRLNQSGRFELPPTRVEALYAPEMFGEMPNAAIEVAP